MQKKCKNSFPKDFFALAIAVSSAMHHVHNGEQEEQVVQASCKEKILTAPVQEAAEGVYEAEAVPESASKRKLYDGVPKIRIQ